ncbi:leguminosin proline-rich group669 secreted peptide [Medicago truncatula]|nr:leguminosin proline-rich group669 secreted peptide [Medicago truncatula]
MSYLSMLAFFLTVISLNNITGNPKHQIHAQPNKGVIDYQPPPIDSETPVGDLNPSIGLIDYQPPPIDPETPVGDLNPSIGLIDYQPPPVDPETPVGDLNPSPPHFHFYRQYHHRSEGLNRPRIGGLEDIPHIRPRRPVRPPA